MCVCKCRIFGKSIREICSRFVRDIGTAVKKSSVRPPTLKVGTSPTSSVSVLLLGMGDSDCESSSSSVESMIMDWSGLQAEAGVRHILDSSGLQAEAGVAICCWGSGGANEIAYVCEANDNNE